MSKLKAMVASILLLPILGLGVAMTVPASTASAAADCTDEESGSVSVSSGAKCAKSVNQKPNIGGVIKDITNVLLFIIGAVAVIMVIVGGIRYTISNGDASQVTAAKNTILYSVIGIIVALLAYAIVNFVVNSFTTADGATGTEETSETE